MDDDHGTGRTTVTVAPAAPRPPASAAELRAEIERTRTELGETFAALAGKTDVKGRARHKAAGMARRVRDKPAAIVAQVRETSPASATAAAGRARDGVRRHPVPVTAIAALAAGLAIGRAVRGR
jgi:Protein of unknown function (DUF3618)